MSTSQPGSKEVVDDGRPALLYAVYCIAKVPIEVITEFILKTRHDDFPVIITSKETHLSDYVVSTRLPPSTMEYPFLGYDLKTIAQVHKKQTKGLDSARYGAGYFVILDEKTISEKTCLIVDAAGRSVYTLRSDFDMALECSIPGQVMGWRFHEMKLSPFFYDGITVTRELYDRARGGEAGDYTPLF